MNKVRVLLTMTIIMSMIFGQVSYAEAMFPDVSENAWYADHVKAVAKAGIIIGNSKGEFMPQGTLNADQFIKTMVVASGYDVGNGELYWASKYIDKARELNIIDEKEYYTQAISSQPITRAQMAKMIQRVLYNLEGSYTYTKRDSLIDYIPDNKDVTESGYKDYIYQVYERGIITGDTYGTFKPYDTVTRAEASAVLHRIIDESVRKPFEEPSLESGTTYTTKEFEDDTYYGLELDVTKYMPTQHDEVDVFLSKYISDSLKGEVLDYVKGKTVREQSLDPVFFNEGNIQIRVISKWMMKEIYVDLWVKK